MIRLTSTDMPYLFSYHTRVRELLEVPITSRLKQFQDTLIICNFSDYLAGVIRNNPYTILSDEYSSKDFIDAKYYLDSLLRGSIISSSTDSFIKILQLFTAECVILSSYLTHICETQYQVIPTFPKLLLENMDTLGPLKVLNFRMLDCPQQTVDERLCLAGWFMSTYKDIREFEFSSQVIQPQSLSDPYYCYVHCLLKDLKAGFSDHLLVFEEGLK